MHWISTGTFVVISSYCVLSKLKSLLTLNNKTKQTTVKIHEHLKSFPQISSIIEEPLVDLLNRGGKRIRILLAHSVSKVCCSSQKQLSQLQPLVQKIAILIQSLHNASLIIDDIQDNSEVRRGEPTSHLRYGIKNSIISANYTYFKLFNELLKSVPFEHQLEFNRIFCEQMVVSHLGQADDLFAPFQIRKDHFQVNQFTQNDYIRMVVSKTGSLLRMMIRMISEIFKVSQTIKGLLIRIVENTGIAFQIYDDYLNIKGDLNKGGIYEDLIQRKLTLMVIKTISKQHNSQFLNMFLKSQKSQFQISQIVDQMQMSKSFQYALQRKDHYGNEVFKLIAELPYCIARDQLQLLLRKIIYR